MKNLKFKKRIVALLLCGAMLLGVVPSSANVLFAAAEDMPGLSTASTSTEVVSLRDANTKHFYMGNGVYQAITYSHPVHEQDSEGAWQDIDFGLTLTGTRSNRMYANEASGAAFAEKYVANQPIMTLSDDGDSISMTMNTTGISGAASRAANTTIAAEVTNPQKTLRTFEEAENAVFSSKILYEEVLPGVDLEYVVDPGTVKENIIVKEKADTYQYSFSLDLTGLYPVMLEDGSIIVCDLETDEQKYEIPAPFMYDAYGELSEDVAYTLTGSGNTYTLTVTANADWINAEGRNFPVTIDPTYTVTTKDVQDTYIDSDKPNTRLGSNGLLWARHNRTSFVRVSTPSLPSGSTVTSAKLRLYYYFYEGMTGSVNLTAHRMKEPWEESELTWNKLADKTNFGLESTPLAAGFADAGNALEHAPKPVDFTITNIFEKWVSGEWSNYGIGVKYVSPSESMSVIFYSSEGNYTYRPRIVYKYIYEEPPLVSSLVEQGFASSSEVVSTSDGFSMLLRPLSSIFSAAGISSLPEDPNASSMRSCANYYDDWFVFSIATSNKVANGLVIMREQEYDNYDGNDPGVTISFVSLPSSVVTEHLLSPTVAKGYLLLCALDEVTGPGSYEYDSVLVNYFKSPQSDAPYLVADEYVKLVAKRSTSSNCIYVPDNYISILNDIEFIYDLLEDPFLDNNSRLMYLNELSDLSRIPDAIAQNNSNAGYDVFNEANNTIMVANVHNLTSYEKYAILATHTANVTFNSFAAEVQAHAAFVENPTVEAFGYYENALRADMAIGEEDESGMFDEYYDLNSNIVQTQIQYHGEY